MKKQRGITLIALVITIIVLLILAGVSISLVVGENGILNQATIAVEENRKAAAREEVAMAWASVDAEYWNESTKNTSKTKTQFFTEEYLNKYLSERGEIVTGSLNYVENGTSTLKYKSYSDNLVYDITIDERGNIENIVIANSDNNNPSTPEDNNSGNGSTSGGTEEPGGDSSQEPEVDTEEPVETIRFEYSAESTNDGELLLDEQTFVVTAQTSPNTNPTGTFSWEITSTTTTDEFATIQPLENGTAEITISTIGNEDSFVLTVIYTSPAGKTVSKSETFNVIDRGELGEQIPPEYGEIIPPEDDPF